MSKFKSKGIIENNFNFTGGQLGRKLVASLSINNRLKGRPTRSLSQRTRKIRIYKKSLGPTATLVLIELFVILRSFPSINDLLVFSL